MLGGQGFFNVPKIATHCDDGCYQRSRNNPIYGGAT
jgi:hypothetical protein